MKGPLKEIMDKVVEDILAEAEQDEVDYLTSLDEMATVGRSTNEKLLIQVNPGEKEAGNSPYFKFFNSANESSATYLARIRFDLPVYEIHARKWNRGKDYWWLNSKEKHKLITFLKSQNTNLPQFINWKVAILSFNNERGLDYEKTQKNLLSNGNLDYSDFMPFDLPMPNYMLLPPNKNVNSQIKSAIKGKSLSEAERIIKGILNN